MTERLGAIISNTAVSAVKKYAGRLRGFMKMSRGQQVLMLFTLAFVTLLISSAVLSSSSHPDMREKSRNVQGSLAQLTLEENSRIQPPDLEARLLRLKLPPDSNTISALPVIYAITPTYDRPTQIPELTRLYQTILHVPNLHWIVCEDSNTTNVRLQQFLRQLALPHTHLLTPMPAKYRDDPKVKAKPKGVAARNAGVTWVLEHASKGVIYFMDDDNTYDIRLFAEMRWTKRVSMWPVGLVTGLAVSTPVLEQGRHVGWYDGYLAGRKYPVDMAGFAVSVQYIKNKGITVTMPYKAGYEEDGFLRSLKLHSGELEFKANGCSQILVWHTRSVHVAPASRLMLQTNFDKTNVRKLQADLLLQPLTKKNINQTYTKDINKIMKVNI